MTSRLRSFPVWSQLRPGTNHLDLVLSSYQVSKLLPGPHFNARVNEAEICEVKRDNCIILLFSDTQYVMTRQMCVNINTGDLLEMFKRNCVFKTPRIIFICCMSKDY